MTLSTRRHALTRMAAGFGTVGLAGLLAHDNPPHFAKPNASSTSC